MGQSASGYHNPSSRRHHTGLATYAARNAREIAQANRRGADMIFLSPCLPDTLSHPGAPTLGPITSPRWHASPVVRLSLGGMNASRFPSPQAARRLWLGLRLMPSPDLPQGWSENGAI